MESARAMTIAILITLVTGSQAATSLIVPPIRSTGDEAAVIFVPGASIKGEAYMKTAVAIQNASPLRLWVALTGNYTVNTPNPLELPGAISSSISQLKKAGMNGDNYVGVAHSLGGVFLAPYAKTSDLKAIVLLGSYLTRGNALSEYPIPVLTLSGELDGQARITRIAVEYEELQHDITKDVSAMFRTPVINMKGTSHAQFASGPMPPAVVKYDLQPEVSEEEAHEMIGTHVSNFLTVTFQSPASNVSAAKTGLMNAYIDSGTRFEPLLKVKALDSNGTSSPWSVSCQLEIAKDLQARTKVENTVETNPDFTLSKPRIVPSGSDVTIQTTTLIDCPSNPLDISTTPESPQEIDVKFKSYDAIQEALNAMPMMDADVTCKTLNQLAVNIALQSSTPYAQQRYKTKGRPITFEEDIVYGTGIQWVSVPLQLEEDDAGLHVQSVALKTSIRSVTPGMFYCKLLSPYRAMEWINVDSLRKHKPSKRKWFSRLDLSRTV